MPPDAHTHDPAGRAATSVVAAAVLAAVVTVVAVHRLASADAAPPRLLDLDIAKYFIPAFEFLRRSFFQAEAPLWNPYQMAGYPFAATMQPGVYYPLLAGLFPFPAHVALSIHALGHVWLSGLFTWSFARSLGLNVAAALAAGVIYLLSAAVTDSLFNPATISAVAWLPCICWRLRRLADEPDARNSGWLAGAVAMAFLAGHPQTFYYTMQFSLLYGAFLAVELAAWGGRWRRYVLAAAGGGGAGSALLRRPGGSRC